jgi:hypothetical protein
MKHYKDPAENNNKTDIFGSIMNDKMSACVYARVACGSVGMCVCVRSYKIKMIVEIKNHLVQNIISDKINISKRLCPEINA